MIDSALNVPMGATEDMLGRIVPLVQSLATELAALSSSGAGLGSLFGAPAAQRDAMGGLAGAPAPASFGAGLAAPPAGGARTYTDSSSMSFQVNGAQSPQATAAWIAQVQAESRARSARATRDTLAGGER
jgi:hypothetical protein